MYAPPPVLVTRLGGQHMRQWYSRSDMPIARINSTSSGNLTDSVGAKRQACLPSRTAGRFPPMQEGSERKRITTENPATKRTPPKECPQVHGTLKGETAFRAYPGLDYSTVMTALRSPTVMVCSPAPSRVTGSSTTRQLPSVTAMIFSASTVSPSLACTVITPSSPALRSMQ